MSNYPGRRYWWDKLSKYVLIFGAVLCITKPGIFVGGPVMIYAFWRTRSSNIEKRIKENAVFEQLLDRSIYNVRRIMAKVKGDSNYIKDKYTKKKEKRNYCVTTCQSCNQKLRLPKKKGILIVTCPKCNSKFEMRT